MSEQHREEIQGEMDQQKAEQMEKRIMAKLQEQVREFPDSTLEELSTELRKEVKNMGTSSTPDPKPAPVQAVVTQLNILDRINQAVINISGRLEFVRKLEQPSTEDVKPEWGPNANMSELANAQSELAYKMELVSDKLNYLYESIDV